MHSISDLGSDSEVLEFQGNPSCSNVMDSCCFPKTEDIWFALEWSNISVYQLLWKTMNKKKYAKASEKTSKLEVIATVIQRFYDFESKDELYLQTYDVLIHQTVADGSEWLSIGLKFYLPKDVNKLLDLKQNELAFDHEGNLVNLTHLFFIRDLHSNDMVKEVEKLPESMFRFQEQKDLKEYLFETMENNSFNFRIQISRNYSPVDSCVWGKDAK